MPILVYKQITNFNNALDSQDKSVSVGIDRVHVNNGTDDEAPGRERGNEAMTIIQGFKRLLKPCVFVAHALLRCQGVFSPLPSLLFRLHALTQGSRTLGPSPNQDSS